ncbi:MAG TPA: hypothetical protein VNP98_01895 [Chthoniobacterales bacterium]|nr:hypothetical protein [Chthoniobacterales bacterium]
MEVIIGFSDSDRLLCHYTPMARAERIFAERRLRFGRFSCTNDPKESKDWKFTLISKNVNNLDELNRQVRAEFGW